jgi:hypothetical protein
MALHCSLLLLLLPFQPDLFTCRLSISLEILVLFCKLSVKMPVALSKVQVNYNYMPAVNSGVIKEYICICRRKRDRKMLLDMILLHTIKHYCEPTYLSRCRVKILCTCHIPTRTLPHSHAGNPCIYSVDQYATIGQSFSNVENLLQIYLSALTMLCKSSNAHGNASLMMIRIWYRISPSRQTPDISPIQSVPLQGI